ncbi:MAG: hypothetical protein FVQ77_17375 [Cytophagales bacterium]|nr:hypothetical protein [Cytophagales bacterium]
MWFFIIKNVLGYKNPVTIKFWNLYGCMNAWVHEEACRHAVMQSCNHTLIFHFPCPPLYKQAAVGSGSWQSCLLLLPLPTLTFGNLSPFTP